jgi:hypothetical protein
MEAPDARGLWDLDWAGMQGSEEMDAAGHKPSLPPNFFSFFLSSS